MTANIMLTLAYDGTAYIGWQRQPAACGMSVQRRLEEALAAIYCQPITVAGAGRTDSGVHALGQCCTFSAPRPVPVAELPTIVNRLLPGDIRVLAAVEKPAAFHARFSAVGKRYRYVLERGAVELPFNNRFVWQPDPTPDAAPMREAAACLLGYHDFTNFTVSGVSARDLHRRITELTVSEPGPTAALLPWQTLHAPIVIEAAADGFLYKMVRIIVGRLVAVGQGRITPQQFAGYLDGSFSLHIPPASAYGLCLQAVDYGDL